MSKFRSPKNELLLELLSQFPEVNFKPGEELDKTLIDSIILENSENITEKDAELISSELTQHPDLEVILEKFDAKITKKDPDLFIITPDLVNQEKKQTGFFLLKDKLLKVLKKL